ncbi:MAG: alpha/beta fold hydrolase [Chloroflexota bacterium]
MNTVQSESAVTEEVLLFGQEDANLVGVITDPPAGRRDPKLPAIILLNPGLIHRVGPHRLYVKLARRLAERGHVVLRFDLSGIGESRPRTEITIGAYGAVLDTFDAMTWLHHARGSTGFILMGHCSGAWHSLITAYEAPTVHGVVAMDIEAGSDTWVRYDRDRVYSQFYRNYYLHGALPNADRWKRFLTGKVSYRSIARNVTHEIIGGAISTTFFRLKTKFARKTALSLPGDEQAKTLTNMVVGLTRVLAQRGIPVLFVHSAGGTGAEFIDTVATDLGSEALESGKVRFERLPTSDRLYTLLASQEALLNVVCEAVQSMPMRELNPQAHAQAGSMGPS